MSDWTAGYVADIGYTYGYYPELNPLRVKLAFLNQGLVFPEVGTACELGFGQGLSVAMHAAASVVEWHGTDFNPAQAGYAQQLAAVSGSGPRLYDQAFDEFARRTDLPQFDYIGLHGIWSWISDENRAVIVEFIRTRLKVGGVLYISYNTLPGWAAFAPMRHLLSQHAAVMGAEGNGTLNRIDGAVDFAEKLLATNPLYSRVNTSIADRMTRLKTMPKQYLAHEYFNRDWVPMHFATMAEWLEPAKLQFACTAHPSEQVDALNLNAEQQQFLKSIPDANLRESTRDFIVNQQFRRDYWVKGARKLNAIDQAEALRLIKVVLVAYRPDVSLKMTGGVGEVTLTEVIYAPLLDLLADHKPRTLGQIEQALQGKGISFAQIQQGVTVLAGAGHLAPAQDDAVAPKLRKATDKLNTWLANQSRGSNDVGFLASPVTGGGIAVSRTHQFFLLALAQGKKQPAEWAQLAWQILSLQGQKLVKSGQALETPEENLAELTEMANAFAQKQVPMLKALQVI
ncbi:class I SAM-dependent methyltransferase [Acidovorax sp. A1169]|uniref:class I SAM-dependent methyltransferase n=1 Tax=Acidovorax sp. A1169 TaxID=3059524 RepID=UPI002737D43F|nr:class I SAM-dependent methyltransferase [Acidovorax sp. A1169]MDP4076489.1 class I SAM-dependent methyltransferase [Acidovorax sp. A1169]